MTPGNHQRIALSEIRRLQGSPELPVRCALYARVSTFKQAQAGNLERQSERLRVAARTRQYDMVAHSAEYASSLNEKRRGMNKLFSLVENQAIDVVLIEYPDRLVRFGLPYLEQAFGGPGVRLEVLEQRKPTRADRRTHSRLAHARARCSPANCMATLGIGRLRMGPNPLTLSPFPFTLPPDEIEPGGQRASSLP